MENIKVGDFIYHPCSIDIIEHKVVAIIQYEGFKQLHLKAVHNVGACGRIEVIIDCRKDKMIFVELVNEDTIDYASGLQDFVEGFYYESKSKAREEFYSNQLTLARSNMYQKERLLKEAKDRVAQIEVLLKNLKDGN